MPNDTPKPPPSMMGGVPIIGQEIAGYAVGGFSIGFPAEDMHPDRVAQTFQGWSQQPNAITPGFVLLWQRTSMNFHAYGEGMAMLQQRIEQLEAALAKAGIFIPPPPVPVPNAAPDDAAQADAPTGDSTTDIA